jgi:predicted metalloprotease with PDZ domain
VTLAPFDDQSVDDDGSGFTDAFMLFLSHEDTFDETRVRLLAHEIFHHWNPMSMGPMAEDEALRWFFEGFTAYYEAVIPLRAGLLSYGEYLDYLNRRLREYQTSPLRKLTIAEWQKVPHSSGPGYELSYSRGAVLALWADAAIRERSEGKSSLDNVMLDLVRDAQGSTTPELTEDRVFAALARYLGPDLATQMRAMAIQGADVPLPRKQGDCAELEQVTRTVVSPGFDEKTSVDTKHIAGVDPEGPLIAPGFATDNRCFESRFIMTTHQRKCCWT